MEQEKLTIGEYIEKLEREFRCTKKGLKNKEWVRYSIKICKDKSLYWGQIQWNGGDDLQGGLVFQSSYNILDIADIETILKIDQTVYLEHYQSDLEQILNRYNKHKESFTVVKLGDDIVGYICYFPIDNTI